LLAAIFFVRRVGETAPQKIRSSPRSRIAPHAVFATSTLLRYFPVWLSAHAATCSGVP
jgi:hypothetical protein